MFKLRVKIWLAIWLISVSIYSNAIAGTGYGLSGIFTIDNRTGSGLRITSLVPTYAGVFPEGVEIINTFTATVDWTGKTPSKVVFQLNGVSTNVSCSGTTAQKTYNMGQDLNYSRSGAKNELKIWAVASDGSISPVMIYNLWGLELPEWAISLETKLGGDPNGPRVGFRVDPLTGKLTFYGEVSVLKERPGGTVPIPDWLPEVGGEYGVKINPLDFKWELAAQPRFGDSAGLTGTFDLSGTWGAELKCGTKRKGEVSATLSGEGEFYPELKLTDVSAELAGKFTFLFPRVPLLCHWGCCHTGYCPYFQASIAPEISGTVGMEEGEPNLIAGLKFKNAELNLGVTVAGTVGAGSEGSIYYIAGTIGGKPYIVLQFPGDPESSCLNEYIKKVAFDLQASAVFECMGYQWGENWTFNLYTCPETGMGYAMALPSGEKRIELVQREYLNALEGYCVFPAAPKGGMKLLSVGGLPSPILNVGTGPMPSVAATNNSGLLVFVYDDPCKPTGKHQEIYYARWNGSGWTTHSPLTNNMNPDLMPAAAIDVTGNEIAVWVTAPEPNGSETGPRDILPGCDIVFSKYDSGGGIWSAPQKITNNTYADLLPWFEKFPTGGMRVCWIASQTNAIPVWHDEEIAPLLDMMAADWNGTSLGAPYAVATNLQTVSPPSICRSATDEFMAYVKDTDNSSGTAEDREIVVRTRHIGQAWGPDQQLTSDSISDTAAQVAINEANIPMVIWVKRMAPKTLPDGNQTNVDQLWFAEWNGSSWATPQLALEAEGIMEPKLIRDQAGKLVLFWVATSNEFSDIYYSVYDSNLTKWGPPQQITHDQGAETMISLTESGGNILAGYVKRRIDLSDANVPPVIGLSDIYLLEHIPARDLFVSPNDISFDPNIVRDVNTTIYADIHLSGDFSVSDVNVRFYQGDPNTNGVLIGSQTITMMLPGQTAESSVVWHVPNDVNCYDIYVVVDPNNDIPETDDVNNNIASKGPFKPDLRASNLVAIGYPGANTVLVGFSVRNDGEAVAPASECRVYKGSLTGEVLFTTQIDALEPGASATTQFTWDVTAEDPNIYTLVAVADVNNMVEELNEGNNSTSGQISVLPDLQAEPWSPAVNGTTASVTVRNVGPKPSNTNTVRVTHEGQVIGESPVVALAPTESTEVVISLSQSVPYGRVEITANPDSNGSDEVTLQNNTAVVIHFAPADFEPDGDVDVNDLATLCQEWLSTTPPLTADIAPQPPDGIVNFLDFAEFAKYWLEDYKQ